MTGSATGIAPDTALICEIKQGLSIPLLIGSGLNAKNAAALWQYADGAIIGSGFKRDGDLSAPVDRELVKAFIKLIR